MISLLLLPALLQNPAPDEMGLLLQKARAARNAASWDEALKAYDAMLAKDDWHETALFERAQTLGWAGRTDASLAAWKLFRERCPRRAAEADDNLAKVASWGRRFDVALETLDPYVRQGQRSAVLDSAKYLSWAGRYRESLARLDGWLKTHPDDAEALTLRARVLSWDGQLDAARDAFGQVLARNPDTSDARMGLAQIAAWTGQGAEARRQFEALPPEARATPEARLLDAQIALAEGRRRTAVAQLRPLAQAQGPVQKDAQLLLRAAAEAQGPSLEAGLIRTDTSEDLRIEDAYVRVRLPLGDGSFGFGGVRHLSTFTGLRTTPTETQASLAYPLGPVSFTAEAGRLSDVGGEAATSHRLALAWRASRWFALGLSQGRSVVTLTPQAVALRVGIQTWEVDLTLGGMPDTFRLSYGKGRVSAGNTRTSWVAGYDHRWRLSPFTVSAGVQSRGLDYSESLGLGFFNPTRYRFHAVVLGVGFERGRFALDAEARGGRQVVNQQDWATAWGYGLNLSWGLGQSPFTLLAGWGEAVAGLPVLNPLAPDQYREHTLRFALRVTGSRR